YSFNSFAHNIFLQYFWNGKNNNFQRNVPPKVMKNCYISITQPYLLLRKIYLKCFRTFEAEFFKFLFICFYFFIPKWHHFRKFLLPFLGFGFFRVCKMQ